MVYSKNCEVMKMEYTIKELAELSGISTRTLRYYDQINLLSPARAPSNGYRIYSQNEVDLLQQILFFRELGVPLEEIGHILSAPDYDKAKALEGHLYALTQKKEQLEALIHNVSKTLTTLKGETAMTDKEKFEGFKQKLIRDNETAYGKEIRTQYGDDAIDASNAKTQNMSQEQWKAAEELNQLIHKNLRLACEQGDAGSELAQKVCDLHRQWLCMFWQDGAYSKEKHLGLAQMYCADERFKQYYETAAPGGAKFLLEALKIYCGK